LSEEIKFIMRHKPTFLLWQSQTQTGMNVL